MLFVRVTIFARLTTKQNVMKKAKYLIFDRLERNCFEAQFQTARKEMQIHKWFGPIVAPWLPRLQKFVSSLIHLYVGCENHSSKSMQLNFDRHDIKIVGIFFFNFLLVIIWPER